MNGDESDNANQQAQVRQPVQVQVFMGTEYATPQLTRALPAMQARCKCQCGSQSGEGGGG